MSAGARILGLIPARAGSRGIPGKNLKILGGKPLIAWTIEAARAARGLTRIVVSTDGPDIAECARSLGVDVPFMRPPSLAADDTPGLAPVIHALDWLKKEGRQDFDYVMLLQPTSPFRTSMDIDEASALAARLDADAVVSVTEVTEPVEWMKVLGPDLRIRPYLPAKEATAPSCRQDVQKLHIPNGAIYLAKPEVLRSRGTWYTDKSYGWVMPKSRSIDIDTPWDFRLAELLLKDGQVS